ncbi:arsenate reductase family protein [Paenibacillus alkalitolerans]|uniref:arsenate reductase family protein n=1 Tax=Paenibacillus alkalitolerans TaxID=2799335 RepID=UPI0018F5B52E|nr:arsenate reductase family protein [Paenibacillus alkalitolerans]
MNLKAYLYPKCSTCRDALKWLRARGHEVESVDIFETPPSKDRLKKLLKLSGLDIRKFLNTSGEVYREMGLKDKVPHMTEDELLELLSSNGRLIKRPIVTDGKKVTVGFKEDTYVEVW